MVDYVPMTPSRGTLVGMCPECTTLMRRFVSEAQLEAVEQNFGVSVSPRQARLMDTSTPHPDCHFDREV
jgi:hypothetical protein